MKTCVYTRNLILFASMALVTSLSAFAGKSTQAYYLEGKSFTGKIRAQGFIGFIKVTGQLSFKNKRLIWQVKNEIDTGPYKIETTNNGLIFSARVQMANGEHVDWQGHYDGKSLAQVKAIWTRIEGDFIHDLFLPKIVTMVFTPK